MIEMGGGFMESIWVKGMMSYAPAHLVTRQAQLSASEICVS